MNGQGGGIGRARMRRARKARDQMITFAFTFGPRITIRSAQLRRALMSRDYLLFYALSCLILALLNPLEATRQQSLPVQAVIWLGAGSLFHFALLGCSVILSVVRPLSRLGYTPLAYAVALTCSELFNYWFHFMFLGVTLDAYPGFAQRIFLQMPVIVGIEQIFVLFVAPALLDSPGLRSQLPRPGAAFPAFADWAAAVPDPGPRRVEIGGQMFDPQDIRLLIAQEHYTKVVTDGGAQLLRGKISAAADQLPDGLGMRVHRSYWIAYSHAREVVKDAPGRFSIVTSDGERIPLSRDIRKAFEKRLAA